MFNSKNRKFQLFSLLTVLVIMLALSVSTASSNGHFHITVKHQINGNSAGAILAGDPQALGKDLPVDIYVNRDPLTEEPNFSDFKFGEVLETDLPAGNYTIYVTLAGDSNVIMALGPTDIPAGVDVTVTAKLVKQTPTLAVKVK